MPLRIDCSSAADSVASVNPPPRSTDRSNSGPVTAASSSTRAVSGCSRASRWLTTSRTLSGVPSAVSGRVRSATPSTISSAPVSTSSRHSSVTRNTLPWVRLVMAPASSGSAGPSGAPAARSTNSDTCSPVSPPTRTRTTPSERRMSISASDSSAGTSASVSRNVATSSMRASLAPAARWRSKQQRGGVRPVAVLEHQQQRSPAAGRHQQVADGRVQAMPLGVLVGHDRLRQVADVAAQVRQQPGQLAPARPQVGAQLGRIAGPHQLVERLHERPVGGADHGVAGAVQHQRAVLRRLVGDLADEPALARPGLAADQGDAAALALRARQQRPQRGHLAGTVHEREGRLQAQRPGQRGVGDDVHAEH